MTVKNKEIYEEKLLFEGAFDNGPKQCKPLFGTEKCNYRKEIN